MRCPTCSSPLTDGAKICDNCGCGVLPPPAVGSEPIPFIRKESTPRWPVILSVVGILAALAVIAVALLPLLNDDDDTGVSTATSALGATSAPPDATSTPATVAVATTTTAAATTTATATTTTTATTTSAKATTTTAPSTSTTSAAPTTAAGGSTSVPPGTTTSPTSTAPAPSTTGGPLPDPLAVALVEATCTAPDSTDSRGNRISFNALLTIDGVPDTAWRCEGDAVHEALLLTLPTPRDVTIVGAISGYVSVDPYAGVDRFDQNRKVSRARWACLAADGSEVASSEQTFVESRKAQYTTVQGFTKCARIVFEILDSTRSAGRDYTAVSELELLGPKAAN